MIEPTCIFCQGKLGLGQPMFDTTSFKTISQTARCHKCNITQTFSTEGKPLQYTFIVKPYVLVFDLQANQFSIREQSNYSHPLMTCNYIPKSLSPKTVSLERIKTLILFS